MAAASYYNETSIPLKPTLDTDLPPHTKPGTFQEPLNSTGHAPGVSAPLPVGNGSGDSRISRRKYEKLKRWLKMLKSLSESLSLVFNIIIGGIMIWVNARFYSTKDLVKDGKNAWPKEGAKVWPSLLLLALAMFTLITSTAILVRYCLNRQKASESWKITVASYAVQIASWIVVSTLYKYEKGLHGKNNDLWGWSCSSQANAVQEAFKDTIDFGSLCSAQGKSWDFSIAEYVFKIVFALGHFYLHRKAQSEKQGLADNIGGATSDLLQNVF